MAVINFAAVAWNGKEVAQFQDAVMESMYSNPELTTFHNVVENIVAKQQIVFLGHLSKITKADAGCNDSPTSKTSTATEKFWMPEAVKFWISECATNLEETFFVWGLNKGIKRDDLTMGDFADYMMETMEYALVEDAQRIIWFNDPDHNTVDNSPGLLTLGTDITDYTIITGLWSQIYDIVAADPTKLVSISENALGTYALQDALASTTAVATLRSMYQNADKRLKHDPDKFFILTDSLVDNYQTWLETQAVDSSFTRVQAGERGQFDTGLRFRGIPIFCFDFWDRTIRADFDNGTTYYQPHRALLTTKANIPVGVDGADAMKTIEQFYLPKEQTSNWRGMYKIDAKVLKDYLIMAAY